MASKSGMNEQELLRLLLLSNFQPVPLKYYSQFGDCPAAIVEAINDEIIIFGLQVRLIRKANVQHLILLQIEQDPAQHSMEFVGCYKFVRYFLIFSSFMIDKQQLCGQLAQQVPYPCAESSEVKQLQQWEAFVDRLLPAS